MGSLCIAWGDWKADEVQNERAWRHRQQKAQSAGLFLFLCGLYPHFPSLSLSFPAFSLNLSTYEGPGLEIIMLRVPFSTPWLRHALASLCSLFLATSMSPKGVAISKVLARQNFPDHSPTPPSLMPEERWRWREISTWLLKLLELCTLRSFFCVLASLQTVFGDRFAK